MSALLRRYQSTSIRFRVATGAFVLGVLLGIVAVQATVQASEAGLRRQFDDRTETLISVVAAMSQEPLLTAEYAQHNEVLQQLGDDEDILTLDLVDVAGESCRPTTCLASVSTALPRSHSSRQMNSTRGRPSGGRRFRRDRHRPHRFRQDGGRPPARC